MFKLSRRTIVTAGLAGVLAIGICGCSTTTETKTEITTETTDENGSTVEHTETTTTTNENGSVTEQTTSSTTIDLASWEEAWEGTDEKGNTVYYAQDVKDDGTSQALIAVYSPEENALLFHVIGDSKEDDQGAITIVDASGNGSGFAFGVVGKNDDGTTTLDLGDEYGKVAMKGVDMQQLEDDIKKADTKGEFFKAD